MNIYMMCGFPGSGKSTWAKKKSQETGAIIINRDSLLTMFYGYYKFDKEFEYIVRNCAEKLVQEIIDCNVKDLIIDECNLTPISRRFWTNAIYLQTMMDNDDFKIALVWCKESDRNVEFRAQGDLRGFSKEYWSDVINKMKETFIVPNLDIEDFHEIIEVAID